MTMRLGIFAKTFAGEDPARVLRQVRAAGFGCAQFNMACAGLSSLPQAVPDDVADRVAEAGARAGVALAAVSATYNMIHPDPAARAAGRRALSAIAAAMPRMGSRVVTLCTGTRDPADPWRGHPDNAGPAAWAELLAEFERILKLAETHDLVLAVEPEPANVVRDADAARRLLDALRSPRVGIVLDAANLIEGRPAAEHRAVIERAVDLLGADTVLAHAKDRDASGDVVPAGRGVVDFPYFLGRLRHAGFDGPVVTHGLTAEDAPDVAAYLHGVL